MGKRTQTLDRGRQSPGVASSLLTLRLVFCGYYLIKLSVEDLFCEGSSTQRCTRSSVSWQFLTWKSLHFLRTLFLANLSL